MSVPRSMLCSGGVAVLLAVVSTDAGPLRAQNAFVPSQQPNAATFPPQPTYVPDAPPARATLPHYYPDTGQAVLLPNNPARNAPPPMARFAQRPAPQSRVPFGAAPPQANQAPPSEFFDMAETVATVGDQHIFRGDLVGEANIMLAPALARTPPEELEKAKGQITQQRESFVKQNLRDAIQRKLMYAMFLRSIPPDKLVEAQASMAERVPENFAESLQKMRDRVENEETGKYRNLMRQSPQLFRLALLMKELKITTHRELDLFLRQNGSSLEKQHQVFLEDQVGRSALFDAVGESKDVSFDDMAEYYQTHVDDFRVPTRARWEQVTIRFDRFSSKFEAGQAIARIGNELFYGAPMQAVAKKSSHGTNAEKGGYHDWTEWGDFEISAEINDAVFSLPPGELSQIIEDTEGLHIVRVIERQNEHIVPFLEAQVTIKQRIQSERRSAKINKYLAGLRKQIPVWTIYDRPASDSIATPPTQPNRFSR